MRKFAVVLVVATVVVAVLALRLIRGDDEPVVAGSWRELRPPTFE